MKISLMSLVATVGCLCLVVANVRAEDSSLDARLREALHQRLQEIDAQTPAPPAAPPAAVVKPAKPVKSVKPVQTPGVSTTTLSSEAPAVSTQQPQTTVTTTTVVQPAPAVTTYTPQTVSTVPSDAIADQLREAVRARIQQGAGTESVAPVAPTITAPTVTTVVKRPPDILAPPPAALPATKEARLAQLLQQYKTDQISPEQYHTERARIVAEP